VVTVIARDRLQPVARMILVDEFRARRGNGLFRTIRYSLPFKSRGATSVLTRQGHQR
jgi:hypothetical protein